MAASGIPAALYGAGQARPAATALRRLRRLWCWVLVPAPSRVAPEAMSCLPGPPLAWRYGRGRRRCPPAQPAAQVRPAAGVGGRVLGRSVRSVCARFAPLSGAPPPACPWLKIPDASLRSGVERLGARARTRSGVLKRRRQSGRGPIPRAGEGPAASAGLVFGEGGPTRPPKGEAIPKGSLPKQSTMLGKNQTRATKLGPGAAKLGPNSANSSPVSTERGTMFTNVGPSSTRLSPIRPVLAQNRPPDAARVRPNPTRCRLNLGRVRQPSTKMAQSRPKLDRRRTKLARCRPDSPSSTNMVRLRRDWGHPGRQPPAGRSPRGSDPGSSIFSGTGGAVKRTVSEEGFLLDESSCCNPLADPIQTLEHTRL